jgi:hypothetical protein
MPPRRANPLAVLARSWFPLALIGLFLLAVPGVALFALNLLGKEAAVNRYLEENFNLSYHLPVGGWLGLVLLLVPVAILLLYFLKLKRKPLSVPSTFLWKKSVEDLHVNSLLQWLRRNVLLLLQLLTVLVLIYAVMGFRFHGAAGRGRHYILLIDNSASMAVTDVAPSRLAWAKEQALKEIDAYTDDDVGMVIVFNSRASTLRPFTSNRDLLRRAVEGIAQTQRVTNIEEALSLADSLANPLRSAEDAAARPDDVEAGKERTYVPPKGTPTEVHLFSDGRFPDPSEAALANLSSRLAGNESALGNLRLHFHLAGRPGPEHVDNVGLVALNAARVPDPRRPDDRGSDRLRVFAKVHNYRSRPAAVTLRLEVRVDGILKDTYDKTLNLPARVVAAAKDSDRDEPEEAAVDFELAEVDDRADTVLHAFLVGVRDQFPLDDEAWLVFGAARKARVLLAGPPNRFLEAFFEHEATRKVAATERLAPEGLGKDVYRQAARGGDVDLVVFDRCAPAEERDMPQANTFFIGRPPPPWRRDRLPALKDPFITGWMRGHPLLRHVDTLWDVGVDEAFRFDLKDPRVPPRVPRLIEAGRDAPLLFSLPRGAYTDLVMAFPILNDRGEWTTDWQLQPSFPLFLRNVLLVLGNAGVGAPARTVRPGEAMVLRPEPGVKWVTVTPPGGGAERLERGLRPDFTFGATERTGVYRVEREDGLTRSFAVNLLDAGESNVEPRAAFRVGTERVEAGQERTQTRELWKWVVLLALVLLVVEWYIYNGRIYL